MVYPIAKVCELVLFLTNFIPFFMAWRDVNQVLSITKEALYWGGWAFHVLVLEQDNPAIVS